MCHEAITHTGNMQAKLCLKALEFVSLFKVVMFRPAPITNRQLVTAGENVEHLEAKEIFIRFVERFRRQSAGCVTHSCQTLHVI